VLRLYAPGIPTDSHLKLLEMLADVNEEISDRVVSDHSLDGVRIAS